MKYYWYHKDEEQSITSPVKHNLTKPVKWMELSTKETDPIQCEVGRSSYLER